MIDFLGNPVEEDNMVIIAITEGRTAKLSRAIVKETKMRPQFQGGIAIPMVYIEYSNLTRFWLPANRVLTLTDNMLPEKRREKYNATEEAIQPE